MWAWRLPCGLAYVSVYASAWAKLDGVGEAGIMFEAGLTITVTGGQVDFTAYGSITAWIDLAIAPRAEFTVGFVNANKLGACESRPPM